MDSSSSSITSAGEATEALKSLLKVGKTPMSSHSPNETPTASLQDDIQKLLGMHSNGSGDDTRASQVSNLSNGELLIQDLLNNISHNQSTVTRQQILLQGNDQQNSFSVYGREVHVIASKLSSSGSSGSNKVQIHPIVNFDWEHKLYTGNLVAIHKNCLHVAYVLRVNSGGIVRVINRKTAERALLKGFRGRVVDIAFAHLTDIVIGAVDEMGNMFVYEVVEDKDGKIDVTLLLQVIRPENSQQASDYHRLVWCPFIPEEEEASTATMTTNDSSTDDASKLLVLTHGSMAEMWNVDVVTKEYGAGPFLPEDVEEGYIVIDSHTQPIFDASFSPDGTALATASLDGEVKFFQVNLQDKSAPKCLYQWKPHDGKPITSLFFLDDHKTPNPDVQFWKFAITGADNNKEIKVWSCESWTCLQSIYFDPAPDMPSNFVVDPCLKVRMDLSASVLVASDIRRKVLYVMQIHQDRESSRAHVSSVSEFLLTQPCLSLAILDAGRKKFKKSEYGHLMDDITTEMHEDEDDQGGDTIPGILLKLCSVHTKALQELRIKFRPESSTPQPPPASVSSVSQEEGVRDLMSDISVDIQSDSEAGGHGSSHSHSRSFEGQTTGKPPPQPMLMTPEAFTSIPYSPRKDTPSREGPDSARATIIDSARSSATMQSNISSLSSLTQVSAMDEEAFRSARGSLITSQNVNSPQSSVTLTPASSKDMSAMSPLDTPSTVPLPPPTPGEDSALASPPLLPPQPTQHPQQPPRPEITDSPQHPSPLQQPHHPEIPDSPQHSSRSMDHLSIGAMTSQDFLTSSPATRLSREEFKPPQTSQSDIDEPTNELSSTNQDAERNVDDLFSSNDAHQRPKLGSAESSSSTSLEVREILEGSSKKIEPYLGDNMEEETEDGNEDCKDSNGNGSPEETSSGENEDEKVKAQIRKSVESVDNQRSTSEEEIEEAIEAEEEDDEGSERESQLFGNGIWPKPPEPPELRDEAVRLATEALHRAATYTIETHSKPTDPSEKRDDKVRQAAKTLHRTGTYTIETRSESTGMYQDQLEVEDDDDVRVEEEEQDDEEESPALPPDTGAYQGETRTFHQMEGGAFPKEGGAFQREGGATAARRRSLESESYSGPDLTKDSSTDGRGPNKPESSELETLSYSSTFSSPSRLHILVARQHEQEDHDSNVDSAINDNVSVDPAYHSPRIDLARIEQLQTSVQQMVSLLQSQQREIEHMRTELNDQRGASNKLLQLQSQIDNLEGLLTSKVSETLTQHSVTESERLHQVLGQRESHDKQKHDALVTQVTQTLDRTITHKLERVVKDEIRNNVVPKIEEVIQPIKEQLHTEVSQKLTATDQLVKDNIAKLIRSRQTVEAMGSAAGGALQGPIQSACRDVLIPSFEKATQNLFQQLNSSFQRGTHEYTRQLESHMEQVRHKHEEHRDPLIQQLQSMVDAFRAREQANEPTYTQLHQLSGSLQTLSCTLESQFDQSQTMQSNIEGAINRAVSGVQDSILSEVKKLIHEEVVVAMKDQQTTLSSQLIDAMRSGMMTPVPPLTPDPEQQKTEVLQLLRQGQLNNAFQQALSASDLDLVLFVCETVNPSQVFNQIPCPLQQPVLLSLIQQLSADLTSHIDLKHHYLQEAVMNLDQSHSITKEHMPAVLGQLCQKLMAHIKAHPQDRSTRSLKMLLMASQSLLK